MPDNTFSKDLMGAEDIAFDTNRNNESFSRKTSTNGNQNITKVNARQIPVTQALTLNDAESVEDFLSEILKVIGNGQFLGVFANLSALQSAYPTASTNSVAWVTSTRSMYEWSGSAWVDSRSYLGEYADQAALETAHPTPTYTDVFAFVTSTKTFWYWDQTLGTPAWANTTLSGDMLKSTYDPAGIEEQLVGLTASQSMTNKTINGVVLDNAGLATYYLNRSGTYTEPVKANVIGNIMSPLFHMPLGNSMAIPIGTGSATFSRSSTASYVNRYGIVDYAVADEPRFEKQGLLIEQASTNEVYPSENSTDPRWTDPATSWSSVANNVDSPDGTSNADTITLTTAGGSIIRILLDSIPAGTYTASFWIKDITGNLTGGMVDLGDEGTGDTTPSLSSVGSDWVRVSRTITTVGTSTWVDIQLSFTGGTNDVSIWGVQVEAVDFATSYIPTTTAVATRAQETLEIDPDNIPLWSDGFGFVFDISPVGFTGSPNWIEWGNTGGVHQLESFSPNTIEWVSDSSFTQFTFASSLVGRITRLLFTCGSDRSKHLYEDGAEIVANSGAANLVTEDKIPEFKMIGTNAHYKNIRVYDRELSVNEARYS